MNGERPGVPAAGRVAKGGRMDQDVAGPTAGEGLAGEGLADDGFGAEGDPGHVVVVNDEGQHSLWWADRELPAGWRATGDHGTRAQCLARIAEIWTDLRPLSLQRRLAALRAAPEQPAPEQPAPGPEPGPTAPGRAG